MAYYITNWRGIPERFLCEERIIEAKEAGINLLCGAMYSSPELVKESLRLCEKHGIRYMVMDPRIRESIWHPELIEENVAAVCADYKDFPALHSYYITDEPNSSVFPVLGKVVAAFRKYDPAHLAYINLFPNYASLSQLGNASYDEHLEAFLQTVQPELLSYDHYHLLTDNRVVMNTDVEDPREAEIIAAALNRVNRAGFYDNLEAVRRAALAHNVPYMLIILLTEHGPYRYLTRQEISYEVYQTLAYGCSVLSYFTYWTPDPDENWHWRNGMITADGTQRCQHYYDAQAINAEILPIGERIAATRSEAVFHTGEEPEQVVPFTGYRGIRAIDGGRFTIGFFADGTVLIANKDFEHNAVCHLDTDAKLSLFDPQQNAFHALPTPNIHLPAGGGVLLRID